MKNQMRTMLLLSLFPIFAFAQQNRMEPLKARVDVQGETATPQQIIDGRWVAVGTKKVYTIQRDFTRPFDGKPSYRFELQDDDNTLAGYAAGETKGRAELCYCYAVPEDFGHLSAQTYSAAQRMRTVYQYGKGFCPQGSTVAYEFSVYVPSGLRKDVCTIFAQWHGMPSRTLVSDPSGKVMRLSDDAFLDLESKTIFKKDTGYDKIETKDSQGNVKYRAGKPNGWIVEQGGYPPMAFGFSDGYFYIKANSDKKWLSDKTDRCNANVAKVGTMQSVKSQYKVSTIAYRLPFEDFPKDCWVTFKVNVQRTVYGKEKETIERPGKLDVQMAYTDKKAVKQNQHIVNNEPIMIGRNDEEGYYFKFGIYRVGNSTVPVCYNLAGYSENILKK